MSKLKIIKAFLAASFIAAACHSQAAGAFDSPGSHIANWVNNRDFRTLSVKDVTCAPNGLGYWVFGGEVGADLGDYALSASVAVGVNGKPMTCDQARAALSAFLDAGSKKAN
jgi:hypothetical protein